MPAEMQDIDQRAWHNMAHGMRRRVLAHPSAHQRDLLRLRTDGASSGTVAVGFARARASPQVLRPGAARGPRMMLQKRTSGSAPELLKQLRRKHPMAKSREETREAIHTVLARDHRELDQLFDALLEALQADAREDALRLWAAFDDGLCRHMALEEGHILPSLSEQEPAEVKALLEEHEQIRAKLHELGVGIDLHEIRVQTVSDFIEQLRRHASREDELAYRLAQQRVPSAQQDELRGALASGRALRQRLLELGRKVKSQAAAAR